MSRATDHERCCIDDCGVTWDNLAITGVLKQGECADCGRGLCDAHKQSVVDGELVCDDCAEKRGLIRCYECGWLFPAAEIIGDVETKIHCCKTDFEAFQSAEMVRAA